MQWKWSHGILVIALLIPCAIVGCKQLPLTGTGYNPPANPTDRKPDVPSLVNYLNQNAQRVKNIRADVDIDARQGIQQVGLGGMLACQKPRDFRLKANILGSPGVDLGSNSDKFWYWISKADPPYVFHCSYNDLGTGKVRVPFPFQPDMVVAALGIAEYDPDAKYELRETAKTLELIQDAKTPDGQNAKRITVFNRHLASPGQPQVLAHVLRDTRGKLICQANITKVQIDRATNAVLPTVVTIEWPAERLSMKLMLSGIETNVLEKAQSDRLFSMSDLSRLKSFDLARGLDTATSTGVRRAGALMMPRR